MSYLA